MTREYRYAQLGPGRVQVEFGHFGDSTADADADVGDEDLGEED